ncbi:acetylornithine deacetylase/succinyl-diaminopimelate desuccinylase-like protein [Arcanobacterium pluranimalium]|uniref:dipeptidase n=1 Tax=Arcanobacterium pluranimalium TaxID=108028 RepID=UPI0019597861|nr:dipeptidase [Arcanobacterium pluranimalium]MBM7825524.1 acetylornithine deacetylase/succinyl-diaminopimelate desuccinylase-like protein [Arcanobacterium pluranimalium]
MNIESIVSRVNSIFDQTKADLVDLVAIPSVSASSFDQTELDRSAEWIADKARALGLETQVIKIETESGLVGRPAILATRPAQPGKPTVLLYAHHDVQPPGKSELWDSEPFVAQERDGRLYGRGAADDKAGVLLHLAAIEAADPGVGITLFIEGEEEVGSPTFVDFLNTYKETLKSDVIVVADSNNWKVGVPSLTTSLRGVCQLDVNISVLDHALHSGMYSGPTLDAVTIAARLISTLHNDAGEVVVEGLEQRDDTSVDYPEADLRKDMGLLDGIELAGTGSLTSRLWTKPTITVIGMDVTPTDVASNTLIPSVKMTLSMRVAPGQDSREAAEALEKHLLSHVPFNAHIDVHLNEAGPSFQAKTASAATDLAKWALRTAWDVEPVDIGVGGSIPFISDLAEVFPEAEILVTGVEDPDTRAHSENESLHLGDWKKAIIAESLMLSRLGE